MREPGRTARLAASIAVATLLLLGSFYVYAAGNTGAPSLADESSGSTSSSVQEVSFLLVPLVDYLLLPEGINCDYGHGAAGLLIGPTGAEVKVTLVGATANSNYEVGVVAGGQNYIVGSFITDGYGNGALTGSLAFSSMPSTLSLRVHFTGPVPVGCFNLDLVGQPNPLILQSFSSTTSSTTSRTATTTETTQYESSSASGISTIQFQLVPVPLLEHGQIPSGYSFTRGEALLQADGSHLRALVGFQGTVNTLFTVVLQANGQNSTLGSATTTSDGIAQVTWEGDFNPGTYAVGIRIYLGDVASVSNWVGTSIPLSQPLVITGASSSTSTAVTHSESQNGTESTLPTTLRLSPVSSVAGAPRGYRLGTGTAVLLVSEDELQVLIGVHQVNPNTQFKVVLSLGSSQNVTLGTLVTNNYGNGELKANLLLPSGIVMLSILVYDQSTFNSPTLVMEGSLSNPLTVAGTNVTHTNSSPQSEGSKAQVVEGSDETINSALHNKTIPAVIRLSSEGAHFDILDHNFSVSVGPVSSGRVLITVSAQNVTGPRTFLFNINGTTTQAIESGSFQVLFDGQQISEATSLTQVLNPQPGGEAEYVVIQTASGIQLLVEVPHFSVHTIEILGIPFASVQSLLGISAPVLAGALLAVTLLFGALYATRKRVFSFMI